ncbi:MAG TPA: hypothetical protein PKE06_11435 [Flavilitoribacter sp.]|nr:hypothetical protein [Flavilitoribacter sp.]
MNPKLIPAFTIPLAALVIFAGVTGLVTPGFYSAETLNWEAQGIGQDMIDLFLITPVLIISAWMAWRGSKAGLLFWAGAIFYLIYTFAIYCFAVHFNSLFLIYCLVLGLSFYGFLAFLISYSGEPTTDWPTGRIPVRLTAWFLISIAGLFYLLWLSEVVPATLGNQTPDSLVQTGLFTNPVHVLDLSVCLPGLILTGILLLKNKPMGRMLAPVMLTFCILMDITIGSLVVVMNRHGIEGGWFLTVIMGGLAGVSAVLLWLNLKGLSPTLKEG